MNYRYSDDVLKLAERIYTKNSEIYVAMIKGEKASVLVRANIKKKAASRGVYMNYKNKKLLLSVVTAEEEIFDKQQGNQNSLSC